MVKYLRYRNIREDTHKTVRTFLICLKTKYFHDLLKIVIYEDQLVHSQIYVKVKVEAVSPQKLLH